MRTSPLSEHPLAVLLRRHPVFLGKSAAESGDRVESGHLGQLLDRPVSGRTGEKSLRLGYPLRVDVVVECSADLLVEVI